jgi:hypothetical protein
MIQHNASTNLLLLPAEIRNMIFKEVLGGFPLLMCVDELAELNHNREPSFLLPNVCRHIYTKIAVLPYALSMFGVACRIDRDEFVGNRNPAQLEAIQTIQVCNSFLFDAINGTGFGGCSRLDHECGCLHDKSMHHRYSPIPLAMPFTLLFPNLRRICIEGRVTEPDSDVDIVNRLAQHAGFNDWKDYVTMRERAGVDVVEFHER